MIPVLYPIYKIWHRQWCAKGHQNGGRAGRGALTVYFSWYHCRLGRETGLNEIHCIKFNYDYCKHWEFLK